MPEDVSPGTGSAAQPGSQEPAILPFSEVVRFHGHLCPGVTLGYCAAKIAIRELRTGRDVDEQLVAIVENDACGIDAIQAVTGCTMGKGNLIFRNYGKHVYTFINRVTNDAVRISLKDRENDEDPVLKALRARVREGKASPDEIRDMRSRLQEQVDTMLTEPPEKYFDVRHVTIEIPGKARLFNSVKCSKCGETVAESRARVQNGSFVCIPCFDEYTRGW
jgi:formylmethanofuran dehydrogenase subunit E